MLLIGCGKCQIVAFGIELRDANSIATERAEVREDVVNALYGKVVVREASGVFALG